MKSKALIISYYWPPAGGPGVQRWLKFVTYLPECGISPVLYIPANPCYSIIDKTLCDEELPKVEVIKGKILEPHKIASIFSRTKTKEISSGMISSLKPSFVEKLLLWIRGNLFIPDARIYWVKPSVRRVSKYIEQHNIKTIITTGPPHSVHLIGLGLKRRKNTLKWIADFRDPWTTIGYHRKLFLTKHSKRKHHKLECSVLQYSDEIIVTSPGTKAEFLKKTDKNITVITNGYDSPYFEEEATLSASFTISHVGSLLSDRNPEVLWKVLSDLIREDEKFASHLKLQFVGTVSGEVISSLKKYGLDRCVNLIGYVSHREAVNLMKSSQVLLLTEINSTETSNIIPGKLFEYMASKRPILAFGPEDWDACHIIKETTSGVCCNYKDFDKSRITIRKYYDLYSFDRLSVASSGIEKYHRRALTLSLAKLINS